MQFEKLSEVDGELSGRKRQEKRGDKKCFSGKNQCVPAKSGEYHPLLLLKGVFSATYPAGYGPLLSFIQA